MQRTLSRVSAVPLEWRQKAGSGKEEVSHGKGAETVELVAGMWDLDYSCSMEVDSHLWDNKAEMLRRLSSHGC